MNERRSVLTALGVSMLGILAAKPIHARGSIRDHLSDEDLTRWNTHALDVLQRTATDDESYLAGHVLALVSELRRLRLAAEKERA